ncbi:MULTISPECIES: CarD family transcriptional regulator [Parafannyhessea]|jgi:RNA polymerase-interacting CarD/CdnL/TRCF family regulator|uniref:CarD family transcriptional regulator n=1 Tax=Parafannyhessea umbonata TaxID=604330 RepID=A0A1G6M860_9ACTN|nr:CarD family transcriptional regulator [Parafannyhessea umbonata]MCI6682640.1 CarD family transcriptional regulator [Parafannyhessea umbonata]MCI7218256.1 CarD family transcriptional regulator [Parafannyhessea umbonata]MDD6358695.1 CarD family transcriptional regulator [Parafannyhessea umbonata]MDD6565788.1 CarD family transcriptional regulator [Parafannyhessea umbonata]MDD6602616.1 CarD family transcriptional regulator [Parafannyhessea umbonata]
MYKVGQYVVHPGQGVCKVEAIEDDPQATYMLMPVGGRHPMRISFPVASEGRLRPVIGRKQAEQIIGEYTELPLEELSSRSNALEEERFKTELRRGSCRDAVRIAKTFRTRIEQVKASNKRPPVAYERIFKQASERSLQELAVAMGVSEDDVVQLLKASEEDARNN